MTGVEMIAAERERQVSAEGRTAENDDGHAAGEMAAAAACYALHSAPCGVEQRTIDEYWPWAAKDWKPRDPMRDLVRAGALIAAEIDRLQRTKP